MYFSNIFWHSAFNTLEYHYHYFPYFHAHSHSLKQVQLVDACLMQVEPGADRAVMLLLSTTTSSTPATFSAFNSSDGAGDVSSLWLHTIEISTPHKVGLAGAGNGSGAEHISVMHRGEITQNVAEIIPPPILSKANSPYLIFGFSQLYTHRLTSTLNIFNHPS
jgi:hypothetical protein